MPAVDGGVDGLLHRAQEHAVNLLRVGSFLGRLGNGLVLARFGILAEGESHANRFEVVFEQLAFFWRGSLVHAKEAWVFAAQNKVCTAKIGREHRFFNQSVGFISDAGDDFFNAPVFVTHNLRLGGFKVHRTAHLASLQERQIDIVQIDQVRHHLALGQGLGSTGVGQNCRHRRISHARFAVHDRRVKLVSVDLALGGDQHVTHHAQSVQVWVQ